MLRVDERLSIPERELSVSYARSGGPGGQHVNRTASKVVLRFSVRESRALGEAERSRIRRALESRLTKDGEIVVHAGRHRERARNEADARERLAGLLRAALVVRRPRVPTRPTPGAKRRRLEEKRQRSERKQGRRRPESER